MVTASRRLAVALAALLASSLYAEPAAWAWASVEHVEIGQASYLGACAELTAAAAARAADPAADDRLEMVCGRNLAAMATIYGDACAIAGDFLGHPSDFVSQYGAWTFKSKKHYLLLALENVKHFNPQATQSWSEYHQRALEHATAGAAAQGLVSVAEMQMAIQESAFADHFLQDSFAAGHMGFNRTASSAAAAKSFHDAWNGRGRKVTDRAGNSWMTYGDGRLDESIDADGRQHVLDTSTKSIRGVLAAFVSGQRSPDDELAVWRSLPFAIEAPQLLPGVEEIFTGAPDAAQRRMVPLITTIRPARKDTVLRAWFWSVAPFSDAGNATVAGVAAVELALPILPVQTYLGAGGTLLQPDRSHSAVVDTGVVAPLGLSVAGLISDEISGAASWIFRSDLSVVLHAEYQVNLELGDALVSLQIGLSEMLPHPHTGWYGGVGIGYTFSVAGGGSF